MITKIKHGVKLLGTGKELIRTPIHIEVRGRSPRAHIHT